MKFLLVGGGSGGHFLPLVAVAREIRRKDKNAEVHYVGTSRDVENELLVSDYFTALHKVESGKLHRYLHAPHHRELAAFLRGVSQARKIIRDINPDCVFAKGGHVTVSTSYWAWQAGIPVAMHESDAIGGLANQLIANLASHRFSAFPRDGFHCVGLPVREEFRQQSARPSWLSDEKFIVVIGGSQGGRRMNDLISGAWSELLNSYDVVHIAGERDLPRLQKLSETLTISQKEKLHLFPFIGPELPYLFRNAEVVVSRAGSTIFELAASRAAVVLVPLSTSSRNHQAENARVLGDSVLVVDETTAHSQVLVKSIEAAAESKLNKSLRERLAVFDKPEAARDIVETLFSLAKTHEAK